MSNYVFVLDANKTALQPCHPSVARKLLKQRKAAVFRRYPFTIILKEVKANVITQPISLKLDPGSKTTGIALVCNNQVIWGAELQHRGQQIKEALNTRRAVRRSRRYRHTRYRKARFLNRKRPLGWLAPSLLHRVQTTITLVRRLCRYAPITSIAQELVKFDLQKLENPEITGIEYQQGELLGYEIREYLLEKWGRNCVYCGKKDTPLEIEHIVPRSKGGTNRISNLTLACNSCNQKKGNRELLDFLSGNPNLAQRIKNQAKQPLKDATAVNATRWELYHQLKSTGLSVSVASGGKTKFNRIKLNLPKKHWIDAACVGDVDNLKLLTNNPLIITAKGYGNRRLCRVNKHGFPISKPRQKYSHGWQTGDIATVVKNGVSYTGKVVVQSATRLEVRIDGKRIGGKLSAFKLNHRQDGYLYQFTPISSV
jgi:5-methylcytosine-specific restriction endonuclease McrA